MPVAVLTETFHEPGRGNVHGMQCVRVSRERQAGKRYSCTLLPVASDAYAHAGCRIKKGYPLNARVCDRLRSPFLLGHHLTDSPGWNLLRGMQILVSINQPPANDPAATQRWQATVEKCEAYAKQKQIGGVEPLRQGAWLITSQNQLALLGFVLFHAEEAGHSYQFSVADEVLSWHGGSTAFSSAKDLGGGDSADPN